MKKTSYLEESKDDARPMETSASNSTLSTDNMTDEQRRHLNATPSQYSERPQSAATLAMLFDPNDIVDDNSVVAQLVKTQITLL